MPPDTIAVEASEAAAPSAQPPPGRARLSRNLALTAWLALWPLLIVLHLFPIRFQSLRMVIVAGAVLLWVGGVGLWWRRPVVRWTLLGVGVALLAFLALPGSEADRADLQADYVRSLERYEGSLYVWGGETHSGIDCSGLVRCGLIDAAARRGLTTFNPRLLREAFSLWWNDRSAKAMGEGADGRARLVTEAESINGLDHTLLKPGDFAITQDGVHALAYLGGKTWIEADPKPMRVIRVYVPSEDNAWFDRPVRIMRWKLLE
jgi:hypothetical protein